MFIAPETFKLVEQIAELLRSAGETVAVSESCCGGLIASYLVSVPGASRYFVGGTTTYALQSRLKLSGWSETDISSYTGPSPEVALRLARNLKLELGATYTLAETGWAGPTDSESESHQTGTAFFTVCMFNQNESKTVKNHGSGNRTDNMERFAIEALSFLLACIKDHQGQ